MGSKMIKAVAFHGDRKKEWADGDQLVDFCREFARRNKDTELMTAIDDSMRLAQSKIED